MHYCVLPHFNDEYCSKVKKLEWKYKVGRHGRYNPQRDTYESTDGKSAHNDWYAQLISKSQNMKMNSNNQFAIEDFQSLEDTTVLNLIQFIDNWKKFVVQHEREQGQESGYVDWTYQYLKQAWKSQNKNTPILCDKILQKGIERPDISTKDFLWKPYCPLATTHDM